MTHTKKQPQFYYPFLFVTVLLSYILCIPGTSLARISLVSFPLKNETGDALFDWVSAGYCETLSRCFFESKEVQVYDPIFMFQTDSSVWEMKSDSTLLIHRSNWQWDGSCGGRFKLLNDSLILYITIMWSADKQEPLRMEFRESGLLEHYPQIFSNAMHRMFALMHVTLSQKDSTSITVVSTPFTEAFQTYCAGYLYEMRGNIAAALTAYSRAREIDPSMVMASCRLGLLYTMQKKYEAARKLFDQTLRNNPDNPQVIAYMAEFLSDYEQFDIAAQFIEKYRATLSTNSRGLKAAGTVYLRQGEYQRAVATLTQALAAGSENLDIEFLLGQARLYTGEFDRAIENFNHLIKCRPAYLRYYSSLASAYKKSGQLMQAAMTLQSALSFDQHDIVVMIDLSQVWIELKWYEKALQLLKQAEKINPEIGDIYINKGMACWYSGNESAARNNFNRALKMPDVRQSALINIGNMYFSKKEYKKAIGFYNKAEKNGKFNASLEYNLAIAYLNLNKKAKAIVFLDAFLTQSPERVDILSLRAQLATDLKQYDDAIHYYQRILEISPQDTKTINQMVDLYIQTQKFDEAIKTIEEYLAYVPSNRDFVIMLAKVYFDRGWYEVACEKYREIIHDFPQNSEGYLGLGRAMYKLIEQDKADNYDDAIFTLKYAIQYAPNDPLPDELIGNIYYYSKGFRDLAIESWNSALSKSKNESDKKRYREKIRNAK